MKKFISSFAIAASMVCGSAMAQAPDTFNYQGVCNVKSGEVTVTFDLVGKDGSVYTQEQTVKTNSDGRFTTTVGGGDKWETIDWAEGGLTLKVAVNGENVAESALAAVPYANMAKGYEGQEYIENDVQALVENKRAVDGKIAELQLGLEQTTNLAQSLSEDIFKEGGIAELVDKIPDLMNAAENAHMTGAVAQTAYDMAVENADAIENVSSDVQGIQESLRGKANVNDVVALQEQLEMLVAGEEGPIANLNQMDLQLYNNVLTAQEDIDALNEGLATTQEDVMNLTLGNKENKAAIAELKVDVQGVGELVGVAGEIATANTEAIESLQEQFEMLVAGEEGPIANLNQMDLQLYNNVLTAQEDIDALNEGLATTQEDVMNLTLGNKENKAAIADLQLGLEQTTNLAQSLSEDIFKEGGIAELVDKIPDLMNAAENAHMTGAVAQTAYDMATENADAIENVTNDVQGIQEKLRGMASVAAVEELADGLSTTQDDVMNLTEGNKENKAAIADLQSGLEQTTNLAQSLSEDIFKEGGIAELVDKIPDLMNAAENAHMTGAVAQTAYDMATENADAIENVTNDVQGIQEKLRGMASVAAVEELADGLSTTQDDVMNLTEGNKENKTAIADLKTDVAGLGELVQNAGEVAYTNAEAIEALQEAINALTARIEALENK